MGENPRLEELRRRVRTDPASIAFAALAEELRRLGQYQEAVDTCRAGLVRHPFYLSARVTLGRALLEIGDLDAAREELQAIIRVAPDNVVAARALEEVEQRAAGVFVPPPPAEPLRPPEPPPEAAAIARLERLLAAIEHARGA